MIGRTLEPLALAAATGELDVVVVCNGCTDATAQVARRFPGVRVLETYVPSKVNALNLGDAAALAVTRVYLDADVVAAVEGLFALVSVLETESVAVARLPAVYDVGDASWPVRAYYRARSRIPSLHRGMWGAGNYGLSRPGHSKLGRFPDIKGDDLWVDRLFSTTEKRIIQGTTPVVVRVPRSLPALLGVTRRNLSGVREDGPDHRSKSTVSRTVAELLPSIRGPVSLFDAVIYSVVAVAARGSACRNKTRWERDDSSRR